mgnify:CR=1 FL=1
MTTDFSIRKYPRTPHIEGSRLQSGDEDLSQIRFDAIRGRHLVVEEKIDGANSAISFDADGQLLLQSRGHYLTGGVRERHYELMKQWAAVHRDTLYAVLGSRYIMYGEWMYAQHRIPYDALPHYFMEFDVYDRLNDCYLDTASRRELTQQMPICSVPELCEGEFNSLNELLQLIGPSKYNTNPEVMMEGIYIKVEEQGEVVDRMKYVRHGFTQYEEPEQAWLERDIVVNGLCVPIEKLFDPEYRG